MEHRSNIILHYTSASINRFWESAALRSRESSVILAGVLLTRGMNEGRHDLERERTKGDSVCCTFNIDTDYRSV